mmetsp:Transcript_5464/g.20436  ORF Transcript_5464/g.20436 Transcript_5464/m.20436 type:complete len:213 (+) Transcript_5464:1463-2101(+)
MTFPVCKFNPGVRSFFNASSISRVQSSGSNPELVANVFGMANIASAKHRTPSFGRPETVSANLYKCLDSSISNAPAPGITQLSSRVFFTARSPSRTAPLIWAIVCKFGPLRRMVQLLPFTPSTKVKRSSTSNCSYTWSACPRTSGESSSIALMAEPPQARVRRSMLRLFARRSAVIPFFAKRSNESGSIPFWLMTTKFSPFLQISFFRSMMA